LRNDQPAAAGKAFGLGSAMFLGIGSMVGAGIFIVIGQAGAVAGNLVTVSFLIGGLIAVLCGYSLSRLAVRYPSRGGIIEYLVQAYGPGIPSGALGVLFYLAQLVALAAVAKSFGTYAATYTSGGVTTFHTNVFALGILLFFVIVNLIGASLVARSESLIVVVKLTALIVFTGAAMFFIHPAYLSTATSPRAINVFYALGLTFFAYQGFSVITNSVEDMDDPSRTMLRSMLWAIVLVGLLYLAVSIAVFGNLPLAEIVKDRDYALARAAQPVLGKLGFKIIAATALLATASAINATLYAVTQIGYTLAREGNLPAAYDYHVFHNTEGLLISALLIVPMVLFLDLGEIAAIAAIAVLIIQGFTHAGHLRRLGETGANRWLVLAATLGTFGAAGFAVDYTARSIPHFLSYVTGVFLLAFLVELLLRLLTGRTIEKQITDELRKMEAALRRL